MEHSAGDLERRLREELESLPRTKDRRKYIHQIYQQLVPGKKSKVRKEGEYKQVVVGDQPDIMDFLGYVEQRLREHRLPHQADRLREFYSLDVPIKKANDR